VVGDIAVDGRTAFADPTGGTGTAGRAAFSSGTLTTGISSLSTGIVELASGASSLTTPTLHVEQEGQGQAELMENREAQRKPVPPDPVRTN
jgi:X-X-X-Leu-X-X-Gly heptad repeat protein